MRCGPASSSSTGSDTSGDDVARLREENAALRDENATLRGRGRVVEDTPSPTADPLHTVCTTIVALSGLTTRYGERHPEVASRRIMLLEAQAQLATARAEGRTSNVGAVRSALAVMLAEERMSPAGRGDVLPAHPDAVTWRARSSAMTALIAELEDRGTCTPP